MYSSTSSISYPHLHIAGINPIRLPPPPRPRSLLRVVSERAVGIDLGTTNSAIAVIEAGKPVIIPVDGGNGTMPSVVGWSDEKGGERWVVGREAKRGEGKGRRVEGVTRFIGRKMDEAIRLGWEGMRFTPQEISAKILRKLVDDAEKFLKENVTKAVITVPAYFNDSQRTATEDAGRIAGLEVLRIINEPTAASLAYGFEKRNNETILVFDLGGGTFDVSDYLDFGIKCVFFRSEMEFLRFFQLQVTPISEVMTLTRFEINPELCSYCFLLAFSVAAYDTSVQQRIVDWIVDNFERGEGIDLREDRQALQHLTEAAEKAKIVLSTLTQTNISLPFITTTEDGPKHIGATLTRAKFEEICSDLLDRLKSPVENALRDANLTFKQTDEVILVGGSTRIPAVQDIARKMTGKEPNCSANPDEVVALGAAIQAAMLLGDIRNIVLLDVTPLSIGLETLGGLMKKIIPRNMKLPTSTSEVFSTAADAQSSVEINVLQGEREFARDNKSLGIFRLYGIPPAPRGVPQIEVKFVIDANGILSVSAFDVGTGKKQEIIITGTSTLPQDEVDRMVKEAERYAEEDKEKRDALDTKNQADSLVYRTEKQLMDLGDKVPAAIKEKVETKINELKDAISSGVTERIKVMLAALNQEVLQIGQALYSRPAAASATESTSGTNTSSCGNASTGNGEVKDADLSVRGNKTKQSALKK
ncbi:Heat shock 70 kDa protein 7, chloroplastic-like protein [Drosera capensis]